MALAIPSLAILGLAWGHATLVFGTLTTDPAPPLPNAPFALTLEMTGPDDAPIRDATLAVEAVLESGGARLAEHELREVAPGTYRTELVLEKEGAWTLVFFDRTFPGEEVTGRVTLEVGADAPGEAVSFLFPPSATRQPSLRTWLLWLVGLPLLVAGVVTVLVLRGHPTPAADGGNPEEEDGTSR